MAKTLYNFPEVRRYLTKDDIRTCVNAAFFQKRYDEVKWAYQVGRRKLKNHFSALRIACMCGDLETAKRLYAQNPENVINTFDFHPASLSSFCGFGTPEIFQWMFNLAGCKCCDEGKISALVYDACYHENVDNLKFLFSTEYAHLIDADACFIWAMRRADIETAEFIYHSTNLDIESILQEINRLEYRNETDRKKVYQWLYNIIRESNKKIMNKKK